MLDHAPRFDPASAVRLARDLFGLDATARTLTSERDQNFLLETTTGERRVLKIANAIEEPAMLEAQQRAMGHLASSFPFAPRVVATHSGAAVADVVAPDGRHHLAWAITHLPGVPLAAVHHRSPALFQDLGVRIGQLSRTLADFDHPAIHREFYWDLARGRQVIAEHRPLVDDRDLGAAIDAFVVRFDREVAPLLPSLRHSAVHNDLDRKSVV